MTAEKVIFTNSRGDSITLSNFKPYVLEAVEGRGDLSASIQLQKSPYQDGATYIDNSLEPRAISLILSILADDRDKLNEYRQILSKIFNPKLGKGKLIYKNGETVREIEVIPDGAPKFPVGVAKGKWFQRSTINLLAPNPYWRSLEIDVEPLAAFVPLFEFPFEGEFLIGMEGHETVIMNDGDSLLPVEIEIKGPTVNPKITNITTGEFIRVKRELLEGDVMYINTETKEILLNGENVFQYIDVNSVFFSLDYGENVLKYTADSGTETATLNIDVQKRYNAV